MMAELVIMPENAQFAIIEFSKNTRTSALCSSWAQLNKSSDLHCCARLEKHIQDEGKAVIHYRTVQQLKMGTAHVGLILRLTPDGKFQLDCRRELPWSSANVDLMGNFDLTPDGEFELDYVSICGTWRFILDMVECQKTPQEPNYKFFVKANDVIQFCQGPTPTPVLPRSVAASFHMIFRNVAEERRHPLLCKNCVHQLYG